MHIKVATVFSFSWEVQIQKVVLGPKWPTPFLRLGEAQLQKAQLQKAMLTKVANCIFQSGQLYFSFLVQFNYKIKLQKAVLAGVSEGPGKWYGPLGRNNFSVRSVLLGGTGGMTPPQENFGFQA